jgi:hypothetical protein
VLGGLPGFLEFRQFVHGFVVGVLRGGDVALDSGDVLGSLEESGCDGGVGIVGAFGEFGQNRGLDALRAHETPGTGGYQIDEDALGVVGGHVGLVHVGAEFLVSGGVFAGHDDLSSG